MKKYKINFIISLSIILVFICIWLYNSVNIVNKINCLDQVGIIDGSLSVMYGNVTYHDNVNWSEYQNTHGDTMLTFLFDCQEDVDVYYFDATNENGHIDTENIIEGLNWMVENSVTKVNLSLSNKIKHSELEDWIMEHDNIDVFASYNNKLNSYDYPAMYVGVIASGSHSNIHYKESDIRYRSSIILLLNKGFKLYDGNSYLSILSMLKN